jgi:hypothetical protein
MADMLAKLAPSPRIAARIAALRGADRPARVAMLPFSGSAPAHDVVALLD